MTKEDRLAKRRKAVIDYITERGGFSVFWATDNRMRAVLLDRMVAAGEIVVDLKCPFPWSNAEVKVNA